MTFRYGDGSVCHYQTHVSSYCQRSYSRGFYRITGEAENDFYRTNLRKIVIVCPTLYPSPKFTPFLYKGGIAIASVRGQVERNLSVHFIAFSNTSATGKIGSYSYNYEKANCNGTVVEVLPLPHQMPIGSYSVRFNYEDGCGNYSTQTNLFIEEPVDGVSVKVRTISVMHYSYQKQYLTSSYVFRFSTSEL